MSAAEKAAPPRTIGRYEVIAEIAQGGMGVVYLARHAAEAGFQRLVAIKLMHPHLADERVFIDMLRDEARIAARIHHPNVVPILDLGSDAGRYYVVMEYIDGCSLAALLARNKQKRPPEQIVAMLIDALDGLHAAHSLEDENGTALQLVHRDVSPQNVLIGVDGMGRITDFGIAKAETRITSTRPGMRKGKISYMSPEQIKEDGDNIDRRADVFAAGAVLWGALTAQPLFRGQSDAATLHNILNRPIVPPSTVGLKPPDVFDAVCLKALERDPSKRFASAAEMADALREAANKIGLRASRAQVAEWVSSSFATELEARRQAIRDAMRRTHPPDEDVPALPVLAGPMSLTGVTSQSGSMPALTSTPPQSLTSVSASRTVHPGSDELVQASFRPKRTALYAGGGAVALLIALLIFVASRTDESEAPAAHASAPTAPVAAPPTPAAATTETAPAKPEISEPPAPSATALKPRPRSWRDAPPRPRTASASKPEPKAEPAEKPEPKPAPPATTGAKPSGTSTGVKIEKNPYLRSE